MNLTIQKTIDKEICHYASDDVCITSKYNQLFVDKEDDHYSIRLPSDAWWKRCASISRLARRALRLDKCNVVPVENGLVIVRQGKVYHYCEITKQLSHTLTLKNCRNVLHQSILALNEQEVYLGEYGSNPERGEVPIYRTQDAGKTWTKIFAFAPGKARHIHGCYYDPFEDKIWVFTGDFKDECQVVCSDRDFTELEWIGNGQQVYRTCNAFFEEDAIHWIMDSQLENSYHIKLDRKTREIETKQLFPGPVWYIKRLTDGYFLATTANEIGDGVHDQYAHIMVSKDLETWDDIHQIRHDRLPKRFFKAGVIGFADGPQSSSAFYLFAEALKGIDGKVALCKIS